ncbi:sortase [Thalassobacillus devorans]|uniref:Sortase n=1 Tax=Thalassobacillus devorans TaxID=279813 RepID=A0ABQ1PDP4_9BACI|nr:class D sortase [Thalassobacillus devorans]NIK29237.1 sortase A [Thalassobacillus devorans]GGC95143.1 sortase [Thalassobacillus devorans]
MGTRRARNKRLALLLTGVGLIAFGLWFTSTNAYPFLKGYYLFKTSADTVQVAGEKETKLTVKETASRYNQSLYESIPEVGDHMGELIIPKLYTSLPIYHGTDEDELERGVGHFAGSVLPGEQDNTVLSGHRDTVFRRLGEVGVGDELTVRTEAGAFTYRVRKVRIVDQDDRTVIVPKPKATLTVSTCYPFDFIGSAPDRYILIADLIESEK